ncbi:MAG TPA: phenylalanine--tRNA ligase subunit alpha [Nitrospinota bacterium]|nr:phenylalanine--tRNA ligase subunit alpha [Nitrospinota bacterium]
MRKRLEKLKKSAVQDIKAACDEKALNKIKIQYLGRKGSLTHFLKEIGKLSQKERPIIGKLTNEIKRYLEEEIERRSEIIKEKSLKERLKSDWIDTTLDGKKPLIGKSHPITQVLEEITKIFIALGFSVVEGPEIELDYYNFEALNLPKDHPARDMQDTFYVTDDIVLRTHTSSVQIRVMENQKPPVQIIAPGKVYRCDADVTHSPMFYQIEGLMVDKGITFGDLKGILEIFVHSFFGQDTPLRFRPSFFPYTEPSAEVDIGCVICQGKGCRVCSYTGWLEVLGSGMVDPEVFRAVSYDSEELTGFAFGMGIERLAMLKYKIDDIRLFFENDMRFLKQF